MHAPSASSVFQSSSSYWVGLDSDMFKACGHVLFSSLLKAEQNGTLTPALWVPIRSWLQEAARQRPVGSLVWGQLCAALMAEHRPIAQNEFFESDGHAVAEYLATMSGVSQSEFMAPGSRVSVVEIHTTRRYFTRPVLDGLKQTLIALEDGGMGVGRPQPMLEWLFEKRKWNPEPLLSRLDFLIPEQHQHLVEKIGHAGMTAETPHAKLLVLLCKAVVLTNWRPRDEDVFGGMWGNTFSLRLPHQKLTELFVNLRAAMPSQTPRGLATLVDTIGLPERSVDAFFPLPLDKCEPIALLDAIVSIMGMTRTASPELQPSLQYSRYFETRLSEHHPELAQLLNMHFTLFPESGSECTNVHVLVPALEAMLSRKAVSPTDTLALPTLQ